MATVRVMGSGFQVRVKSKLLPKDFYATFDTEQDAQRYGEQLDRLLKQGIVPKDLMERPQIDRKGWTVQRCVTEYLRAGGVKLSEQKLLDTVIQDIGTDGTWHMNFQWGDAWVKRMKRDPNQNLAPSTIRHRVGALARCLDWVCRFHTDILIANPLRSLRKGFATYSDEDAVLAIAAGGQHRRDEKRTRRFPIDEKEKVEKALEKDPEAVTFMNLAYQTAMRMRETYTLTLDQVNLEFKTIYLSETKNGDTRQVPLSSEAVALLEAHIQINRGAIAKRGGRIFRWWNGDPSTGNLDTTTCNVSHVFSAAFDAAGSEDLHFHDIRHEATCQLFIRTRMSDLKIAAITGHRDPRMLKRYANLRGSELASEMW